MGGNALKRLVPLMDVMVSGFSPDDEIVAFRYDHFVWKLSDFTRDHAAILKSFSELAKIAESRPPEGEARRTSDNRAAMAAIHRGKHHPRFDRRSEADSFSSRSTGPGEDKSCSA
jgi:hypothetical protein